MSIKTAKGAVRYPRHRRGPSLVTVRFECPDCGGPHAKTDCLTRGKTAPYTLSHKATTQADEHRSAPSPGEAMSHA
jgi:hypothetical protein